MEVKFLIPREEAAKRMETCKSCVNYIKFSGQCKLCGCIMKVKTKLIGQECPEKKW